MKPVFIVNNHDYTDYLEELSPTTNDLDSEESGRDVQTGYMYRTKIATKQKWTATFLRMREGLARQLFADVSPSGGFFDAQILDPTTGTIATRTFYTSGVPFGVQRWLKDTNTTVYEGISLEMTER